MSRQLIYNSADVTKVFIKEPQAYELLWHMNTGLVLAGLLIALKRIHRTDQSGPVCGSAGGMRLSRSESLWITLFLGVSNWINCHPNTHLHKLKRRERLFSAVYALCHSMAWLMLVLELVYPEHSRGAGYERHSLQPAFKDNSSQGLYG